MTEEERKSTLSLISGSSDVNDLAPSDLVIEAATEDETVKRKIYTQVCPVLKPEALLATNTSSLSITRLAAATDRPERFMHPGLFWPRRSIRRYPGHFKVRILPPIAPGMDPDAFFAHLIEVSERASDELLLETVAQNPHLPLPPTAVDRLVELRKLNAATG